MSRIRLSSLLLLLLSTVVHAQGVSTSTPGFTGNVTGCATTSSAVQKGNGNGGCAPATAGTDFATPSQVQSAQNAAQSYASNAANIVSGVIASTVLPMASMSTPGIVPALPPNTGLFLRSDNTWQTVTGGTATTDAGALTTGILSPSRLASGAITNDKLANSGININGTVVALGGTISSLTANVLRATLSGGSATGTVLANTTCFPTNASSTNYPIVSVSGTTVTVTGNGSDVITLLCVTSPGAPAPTATTTTLALSPNSTTYGQSVSMTATVSPSSGPTGSVTFKDGSTVLGTGTVSSGVASFNTSSLSVGTHSITAVYPGDNSFSASTSAAATLTVASASGGSGGPSSDSFNYTGALQSPPWTNVQGEFYIGSPGQLTYGSTGSNATSVSTYTGTSSTASQISCVTTGGSGAETGGPALRVTGANNGYYLVGSSSGGFSLYLNNAPVSGVSFGNSVTPGHTYCASITSTDVITMTADGTSIGTYTDTTHGAPSGSPGIIIYGNAGSGPYFTKWTGGSN